MLDMSVAQNVTMAIHRQLFPGTWLRFRAERQVALDFIRDLDVRTYGPDAPGNSLSGGNQQKVSLARWLATNPKCSSSTNRRKRGRGAKSEIHKIIRALAKEALPC